MVTRNGPAWKCPQTGLTRHQAKFVAAVSQGQSYADAYKGAYKTDKVRPAEMYRRANELAKEPLVAAELQRVRAAAREHLVYTVADAVREAEEARRLAMDEKQPGAATGAVTLKAKLLGLMTDKIEQTNKQVPATLPELEAQLRDVMQQLGLQPPADLADVAKDNIVPLAKRA